MEYASRAINRRDFLKLAAATSAGATASFVVPALVGGGPVPFLFGGGDFKIGVLLPTSGSHPMMGENLADGMRTYFNSVSPSSPKIVTESVPGGYSGVVSKATRLVEEERVDIVVAGVSSAVAPRLRDALEPRQVPYIISNTGVSPVEPTVLGKYGVHNSLGLWQSSWATGVWTGSNVGKSGLVITTLADSGHSSIFSFQSGLSSVGGQVVDTMVIDNAQDLKGQPLREQVVSKRPDFVYAMISGTAGSKFLEAYGRRSMPPLFLEGLMAESFALNDDGSASGLANISSWSDTLATDANVRFTRAFRTQTGRSPDPFAALGFETAQMIDRAVDPANNRLDSSGVIKALETAPIVGPRGLVTYDPKTRSTNAPLYLRELQSTGLGARNQILSEVPIVTLDEASRAGVLAGTTSGLLNEYLCCETPQEHGLLRRLFSSRLPAGR